MTLLYTQIFVLVRFDIRSLETFGSSFEKLDLLFMFDGGSSSAEGAQISAFSRLGILFSRIEPVFPRS